MKDIEKIDNTQSEDLTDKIVDTIVDKVENGQHIFLTGQAGVGKSFILNKVIEELEENSTNVAITGSTGMAALHLSGQTIHKFLSIGISNNIEEFENRNIHWGPWQHVLKFQKKKLSKVNVVVIDEISMISADVLDLIDHALRIYKHNLTTPFGGCTMIFSGDFLQLPPVNGDFAFMSDIWKEAGITMVSLSKVYRQDNKEFIDILSNVRQGKLEDEYREFFSSLLIEDDTEMTDATRLSALNINVDEINERYLRSVPGDLYTYSASCEGKDKYLNDLKKAVQAPEELDLKVGARVVSLVNDTEGAYVNGSVGKIVGLKKTHAVVEFDCNPGERHIITSNLWETIDVDGTQVASYRQLPLRLAYAITIHKSQGMTIDGNLIVDCTGIFSCGQLYVALSRVKDPTKLKIKGFNEGMIMAHQTALSFYNY